MWQVVVLLPALVEGFQKAFAMVPRTMRRMTRAKVHRIHTCACTGIPPLCKSARERAVAPLRMCRRLFVREVTHV